jgi:hypothetical protein
MPHDDCGVSPDNPRTQETDGVKTLGTFFPLSSFYLKIIRKSKDANEKG